MQGIFKFLDITTGRSPLCYSGCLDETWTGKERIDGSSEDSTEEDNKKAKGESGKPGTSKTSTKTKNKSIKQPTNQQYNNQTIRES